MAIYWCPNGNSDRQKKFHFLAKSTTEEKLTTFNMENVASRIRNIAPDLWSLFDILLRADLRLKHRNYCEKKKEAQSTHSASLASHGRRTGTVSQPAPDHGDIEMGDVSLNDWGDNKRFQYRFNRRQRRWTRKLTWARAWEYAARCTDYHSTWIDSWMLVFTGKLVC